MPENRWCRVAEKLPPLIKFHTDRPEMWSGYIWCWMDGDSMPTPGHYEVNVFGSAGFYVNGEFGEFVTHWAPMEQAPTPWPGE